MPVGKLTVELEIPHAHSLKDRRRVVRSVKDALRNSFNISVSEADGALLWNRATLEVAAISSSLSYLTGQLASVERAATRHATRGGALVIDAYAEILSDSSGYDLELSGDRPAGDDSSPGDPGKL